MFDKNYRNVILFDDHMFDFDDPQIHVSIFFTVPTGIISWNVVYV